MFNEENTVEQMVLDTLCGGVLGGDPAQKLRVTIEEVSHADTETP